MRAERKAREKLTVAHFMPWSGMGGVEIATFRMAQSTREQFRHIAFCLRDAAIRAEFERVGIETVAYSPPILSLRHVAQYYKDSLTIAGQLKTVGADIVHFAETKAAEHNSLGAWLAGVRAVCHVRNTYPRLSLRQRLPLLPVDRFIFVSEEARRRFGVSLPLRKTKVIYDAIELPSMDAAESRSAVRQELGIPGDCIVVGMVARVNPQKDYFTLAAAAAKVAGRHPTARFLVVGDNARVELNRQHYEEVMRTLDGLGMADRFVFSGHRDDAYRMIAAMDIVVLSTHREGFGLCIAEAMAMRKPVVATAVGGLLEVVQPGVTGYLHKHKDSNDLAEKIMSLLDNREEAKAFADAGFEHVRRAYSREAFDRELSASYMELVAQ